MAATWIVIVEDRHSGVDAYPFTGPEAAEAATRDWAGAGAEEPPLTSAQIGGNVVLWLGYGTEGDCVSVQCRETDVGP